MDRSVGQLPTPPSTSGEYPTTSRSALQGAAPSSTEKTESRQHTSMLPPTPPSTMFREPSQALPAAAVNFSGLNTSGKGSTPQRQPNFAEDDFVFIDGHHDSNYKILSQGESTHEELSETLLTQNLITKCEIFADIIVSITKLADRLVEKEIKDSQLFLQSESTPSNSRSNKECIECLTSSSTLYLHALTILKPLLLSLDSSHDGRQSTNFIMQSCRQVCQLHLNTACLT